MKVFVEYPAASGLYDHGSIARNNNFTGTDGRKSLFKTV